MKVNTKPHNRCGNCAFWSCKNKDRIGKGCCHRYPPVLATVIINNEEDEHNISSLSSSDFPDTQDFWWCGEWKEL